MTLLLDAQAVMNGIAATMKMMIRFIIIHFLLLNCKNFCNFAHSKL